MFERSWKRVSSWLRSLDFDHACTVILVLLSYALIAFIGGLAAILWRIV